jgi:hypothetical protein
MSNLFQTVVGFFTPKPVSGKVIETVNECGEKRYIEMEIERNYQLAFEEMAFFVAKVRQAKYRGNDIQGLFKEFEEIEKNIKRSSESFQNLSNILTMMG